MMLQNMSNMDITEPWKPVIPMYSPTYIAKQFRGRFFSLTIVNNHNQSRGTVRLRWLGPRRDVTAGCNVVDVSC